MIYNDHVVGSTAKFIVAEPKALQPLQGVSLSSQNVGDDFESVLKLFLRALGVGVGNISKGSKGDADFFRRH